MSCKRLILQMRSICVFGTRPSFARRTYCVLSQYNVSACSNIADTWCVQKRYYARDKPKEKVKKIEVNDAMLADVIDVEKLRSNMQQTLENMKEQYIKNVSLRSAAGSIESITVQFENQEYKLQDLAQINRKNTKVIALNLAVFPQTIPAVIDAIAKSGMNLNPQQDGTSIYVPLPKVTKEHREQLSKSAKTIFQQCKDSIRSVQIKAIKDLDLQLYKGLAKEQHNLFKNMIVAIADSYISEAEKMKNNKQKELLGDT